MSISADSPNKLMFMIQKNKSLLQDRPVGKKSVQRKQWDGTKISGFGCIKYIMIPLQKKSSMWEMELLCNLIVLSVFTIEVKTGGGVISHWSAGSNGKCGGRHVKHSPLGCHADGHRVGDDWLRVTEAKRQQSTGRGCDLTERTRLKWQNNTKWPNWSNHAFTGQWVDGKM